MTINKTDVLIIGTGVAGLMTALSIDSSKKVILVSKSQLRGSNTYYAQGGVAVGFQGIEDIQMHIKDTLSTGLNLADENAVNTLVHEGPLRMMDLIHYGVKFDKIDNTTYEFIKEGAHSKRRIMHVADKTGSSIENVLVKTVKSRKNIKVLEKFFLKELLTKDNSCEGAILIDRKNKKEKTIYSGATILATGGAGMVFAKNTNWKGSTGDGLAQAYKAGAIIQDMEFYQFHPTAIQLTKKKSGVKNFLISEAVRGAGAIVFNDKEERFLSKIDKRGELAPRDIVSRAILSQIENGRTVFLDLTNLNIDVKKRFPIIYKNCLQSGLDITKTPIPIVPVAHYMIGGIKTDTNGQTSIQNLFACGEVASTCVHGANRLASNSLLEGMVFGYRVANKINQTNSEIQPTNISKPKKRQADQHGGIASNKEISLYALNKIKDECQNLMYLNVGIKRDKTKLKIAEQKIKDLKTQLEHAYSTKYWMRLTELQNILTISELIIKAALKRQESRGVHYRSDYQKTDPNLDGFHYEFNITETEKA